MKQKPSVESWDKQFDSFIRRINRESNDYPDISTSQSNKIKHFIRSILSQKAKEVMK